MDQSVFGISHLMIVSVCLLACFPIKGEAESKTTEDDRRIRKSVVRFFTRNE